MHVGFFLRAKSPLHRGFETRAAAKHATDMYNKYMSRATYKGGSKGDWVADDYDILLFIYSDFKKGNIYQ